ncbi:MAG: hypothetical protein Ct9H90mP4_13890 [Gammaproteobacteria bacterium]|nr:MAG: hypothetical protein Ct9H90mP4_13890 [Gammaproteobacteria bacterium]
MKLRDYLFIFIALFCFSLKAEPNVYGKLSISVESQDTLSGTEVDMVSNASRLGFLKGFNRFW